MNATLLLAFWGVAFLLIIVPGPDWAYVLASGLRDRSVLPAVAGIVLGYLVLTAVVATGVGAVVARYPIALTIITVAGACYLSYLGVVLLVRPGTPSQSMPASSASWLTRTPAWIRILRGVGVSGLNPKGLLIFIAVIPQFTTPTATWPFAAQVAALGLLFACSCAIFYTTLGVGARAVLRTRPRFSRTLSTVSGAAMILISVFLLIERIVQLAI